ncbi:translational GTPase TypA [Myxococcota bacterium]|nr:translational GTPase TypA [Myxococcota bacterium]MBU1432743.1 translational GTPase TypA [Myxococcota bacterium]MBU1896914.1 translational GTPase TypA [Myxococcota bacterium]
MKREDIRNIAIIAHVDHGKTTLVDGLLRHSGTVAAHKHLQERAMDRMDLERERGITILSKNTAIRWLDTTINIVDTPGHSDFGGEVERVLGMVDSVLLLVDAFEGPMPQTRFVLRKALGHGLKPMVVINKIDRPDSRPEEVLDQVFDLFVSLEANDEQLDFPVLYASGREGWAVNDLADEPQDLTPLLRAILKRVPSPVVTEPDGPFQMQVATINYDDFVGRIAIGNVRRGQLRKGEPLICLDIEGHPRRGKVTKIIGFDGLNQVEIEVAEAGDIVGIAGFTDALPGETICAPSRIEGLPPIAVDEPTISMEFIANNGPWAGQDGKWVTSRKLRERLMRELQSNVALRVEDTDKPEVFKVSGRGELHLGILIETMRREGYEVMVSMPRVIFRDGPEGRQEPYEDVTIDCGETFSGAVIQELNNRGGEMTDLRNSADGNVRLEYRMPSRGLIGYRSRFLTQTRGTGTIYRTFSDYGPYKGAFQRRAAGVLVSSDEGPVTAYAIETLQERGVLFVAPGDRVYSGQVCGEHSRNNDLVVNPCKQKKLDNMRVQFKELDTRLDAARKMSLEEALEFINPDELVEITPKEVRIRKRMLDHALRRRAEKQQTQSE